MLVFLWVQDEFNYDGYHENADWIYRVAIKYKTDGITKKFANTSAPLAPALIQEFPWIEAVTRLAKQESIASYEHRSFKEKIFLVDPDLFKVFTFPILQGKGSSALRSPNSLLISEEIRNKYFVGEDPIGKIINLDGKRDYKVAGVFKDIPINSHFRFNILASFSNVRAKYQKSWGIRNFYTYILVKPNVNPDIIKAIPDQFFDKYLGKELRQKFEMGFFLQPLKKIHLHSNLRGEIESNGRISDVYIFILIGFFILLIACMNYINLTTAWHAEKVQQVGLRKVFGANSNQLLVQFLSESFLISIASLPWVLVFTQLFLPIFNKLSGKKLVIEYSQNPLLLMAMLTVLTFVGFVSGIFPAVFNSRISPIMGLKNLLKNGSIMTIFRHSLVVCQFFISISFIIIALTISTQVHFMKTKAIGISKKNIVTISFNYNEEVRSKYKIIKKEFLANPNVLSVSASAFTPGKARYVMNYSHENTKPGEYPLIECLPVDHDFLDTFAIELLEGRSFSSDFPSDTQSAMMINEAALKEFNWNSALGKQLKIANYKKGIIIGVVKDFNYKSLKHTPAPLAIYIDESVLERISVRIQPSNISHTLSFLKAKWLDLFPNQPFNFSFLEDEFNALYESETRLKRIFMTITFLAIFIACLGLFGLATFSVQKRMKEVAIRKILGASTFNIFSVLSKKFALLILIANFISWPFSWYYMENWLKQYAYRIDIEFPIFLLAGSIAIIIALISVSYKTLTVSFTNPADILRYE